MDFDTITDTQIHEVETLRYSWGRLAGHGPGHHNRHPEPRGGNTQVQLGETLLDMDPDTITDTQNHKHDVRYNVPYQREGNG